MLKNEFYKSYKREGPLANTGRGSHAENEVQSAALTRSGDDISHSPLSGSVVESQVLKCRTMDGLLTGMMPGQYRIYPVTLPTPLIVRVTG